MVLFLTPSTATDGLIKVLVYTSDRDEVVNIIRKVNECSEGTRDD